MDESEDRYGGAMDHTQSAPAGQGVPSPGSPSSAPATTRLAPQDYLRHLETESARFREVVESLPGDAPVPSCPEWTADDLLWHLGEVQWNGPRSSGTGPRARRGRPAIRPAERADLLTFFDESSASLQDELAQVEVATEVWTWSPDHTAGFVLRRQAHEALIHRLDAELSAGTSTALDPLLAADGVDEALDVMFGGCPPWGTRTRTPLHVRVDCTDTGTSVWVNLARFSGTDPATGRDHTDEDDIAVVPDPGVEPNAVLSGPAGDLDAWLWHRAAPGVVHAEGDPEALERFHRILSQPID